MRIAILAFDGFDELGTFILLGLLNRLNTEGVSAELTSPLANITSVGGQTVQVQQPLAFANEADAIVFADGLYNRAIAADIGQRGSVLEGLQIDPIKQFFGAMDAGSLLMAQLGLLTDMPACAEGAVKGWLLEAGVRVEPAAFHARGSVATASGALAAQHLFVWLTLRGNIDAAAHLALRQASPLGEDAAQVEKLFTEVRTFLR